MRKNASEKKTLKKTLEKKHPLEKKNLGKTNLRRKTFSKKCFGKETTPLEKKQTLAKKYIFRKKFEKENKNHFFKKKKKS